VKTLMLSLSVLVLLQIPQGSQELPHRIRRELDSLYAGWHFAQLDSFNTQRLNPGERPDWVTGDLDANGRADYVVQILSPKRPEDSQQLVVGFIDTGQGFTSFPIDSGRKSHDTYLRINRRGTRGFDLESQHWFTYKRDVLSILYNQTAGMDCPFEAGRFSCKISGD
jgi:hypothetical protein